MCIGATSGVSRLIFGKIADFPQINRIRMQQIAFVVLGIVTACIPLAKTLLDASCAHSDHGYLRWMLHLFTWTYCL